MMVRCRCRSCGEEFQYRVRNMKGGPLLGARGYKNLAEAVEQVVGPTKPHVCGDGSSGIADVIAGVRREEGEEYKPYVPPQVAIEYPSWYVRAWRWFAADTWFLVALIVGLGCGLVFGLSWRVIKTLLGCG